MTQRGTSDDALTAAVAADAPADFFVNVSLWTESNNEGAAKALAGQIDDGWHEGFYQISLAAAHVHDKLKRDKKP